MGQVYQETWQVDQAGEKTVTSNGRQLQNWGHAFDSANQSTRCGLNDDQGAGANAGSRDEMMFVANSSLSELVWSPSAGLSIKYTDCSLAEKNSFLWCLESGNMIFLPSRSIKGKEVDGTVNEEKSSQSIKGNEVENNVTVNEEKMSSIPLAPIPASCGAVDPMTANLSIAEVDSNKDNEMVKKGMDICSYIDTQKDADIYEKITDSAAKLRDNASAQDQDNSRSANSSSSRLEEPGPDLAPVKPEIGDLTKGVSSDEKGGDIQAACSVDILASEVFKTKEYDLPKRSMLLGSPDVKHAESASAFEENSRSKFSIMENRESTSEKYTKSLKTEGKLCCKRACAEVGMIVASQPKGEGKHSPENKVMLIEASLNERGNSLKRRKGKEKAYPDTEVYRSISKEDRSHGSVESSNSGQLFAKGRRAGSFEHQLVTGNKKIKKHQNETPCSASSLRQDSSFMNWISNMMKRFPKFDSDETPCLALPAKPFHHRHGSPDHLYMSDDKIQEDTVGRSTGFQNIFQALYCPRARARNKIKCSLDQQTEAEGSKEFQVANKMPCDNDSTHATSNEEKSKLHELIHVGMSALPNVSSAKIALVEEKPSNSCNISCDSKIGGVCFSNTCFKNDSGSPEDKRAIINGSVDPNKFSYSVASRSPLENLWITRFSPKVSTPMLNSVQFHQDKGGTKEEFTECNRFLPLSQNLIVSIRDTINLEDGREPSIEDQMNAVRRSVQNYSVSPTGSCGSIRTKVQSDQNFKSKLNRILPSQRFRSSEAMASVFARRLDALRNIIPSKVTDNATLMLCFYCGQRGHTLSDCSDIIESELQDLLNNSNLYDGLEETSCLCIRCFQFSHWAVACPHSLSRKQICQDGNFPLVGGEISDRMQDKPQNQNPLVDMCTISQGANLRLNTEFTVRANKMNETMILEGRLSDFKPVKRGLLREDYCEGTSCKGTSWGFVLNEKNAASSSKRNGSKENQILPYVYKQIPTIPRETFEIIRRLRLSRADILKWMKSPNSNFCLEGFFLRLRLGKWEEGLGGTGYHVACISVASQESSSGKCKLPISVDVGGLKCSVDCRYVSNQDFIEEELKAWWCANLKVTGKLPSIEELNMKLVEKEKYGF